MQGSAIAVTDVGRSVALQTIVDAFGDAQQPGLSKTAQLYNAIARMIAAGRIRDGEKLPGERDLCAALGISLGTAQKSLNLLMRDGEVERQHGKGTFARGTRRALSQLWHYRFRDPRSGALLPVYAKLVGREQVDGDADIIRALGTDGGGFVQIRRLVNIDDRFSCWSEMYFGMARFKRLLRLPKSTVESVNLKQVLSDEFDAPTLAVDQTAKVMKPPVDVAKAIGVAARVTCMRLQILATSRRREPITFQRIYVPPVDCELELVDAPLENTRSLAA